MSKAATTLGIAALLAAVATMPLQAQTATPAPDPLTGAIHDGARHLRVMFATAAEQMSDEDYAFRPTPELRTFGQLLAHVAESNYIFCSTALGEEVPVRDVEKNVTARLAIQKVLAQSFAYCERAYAAMSDEATAKTMRQFRGSPRPALAVLNFRNYHGLLHWGNAITYIRLRGKMPPSAD